MPLLVLPAGESGRVIVHFVDVRTPIRTSYNSLSESGKAPGQPATWRATGARGSSARRRLDCSIEAGARFVAGVRRMRADCVSSGAERLAARDDRGRALVPPSTQVRRD
jgi:hypothetical protein